MTADAYHADAGSNPPSLNSGIAKILLEQSPMHAWLAHPRLNPNYRAEEDSRFDLGSAAHALLLEGAQAKIAVIEADDWRKKETKEKRDEARKNGLFPILAKHNRALVEMVDVARKYVAASELAGIFEAGKPEVAIRWQEGDTHLRGKLDWLTDDASIILDYKTCANAHPEAFARQIASMSYDVQAAFYTRGIDATRQKRPVFVFLAQEIEPPYACSLVGMSEAFIEIANAKVTRAIELWRDCLSRNHWPAYGGRIAYAEPPMWAIKEHEERMVNA